MNSTLALVVDDDRLTRMLAREALEAAGLRVTEASDGDEAVEAALRERPDLILLDINMPRVDGYEALAQIRASDTLRRVPVLVLTSRNDAGSVDRAYELGATDFLAKPIHFQLLPHRVRYLLRAQGAIAQLRSSQGRLERSQRMACIADWELDVASGVVEASPLFPEFFGASPTSLDELLDRIHPEDSARIRHEFRRLLEEGLAFSEDHRLVDEDGGVIEVHHEAQRASPGHFTGTLQDITPRKQAERRVGELAFSDALTGLPNRSFLNEHLRYALARSERNGRRVALLALDLDRFKRINDTLGHHAGDELLQQAAARLRTCVRRTDALVRPTALEGARNSAPAIARFGGDEFLIVLPDVNEAREPAQLAERIVAALREPYVVAGREVESTPSLGIAMSEPGQEPSSLLSRADAAMYEAKGRGGGTFCFHNQEMTERVRRRLALEGDLRRALAADQIQCAYQPCIELATGRVRSVEVLARWEHPERGTLAPASFIPVAEETGMIVALGLQVLTAACRAAAAWTEAGHADVLVSVNVSARQLRDDTFQQAVLDSLSASGLKPEDLELELTESVLLDEREGHPLRDLRAQGVRVALDDFGTGFSSLRYLKDLPADTVKIDKSFVAGLPDDGASVAIATAVTRLMSELGLDVIAEGVQTEQQRLFLAEHGCKSAQGFFLARPMPLDALLGWLAGR